MMGWWGDQVARFEGRPENEPARTMPASPLHIAAVSPSFRLPPSVFRLISLGILLVTLSGCGQMPEPTPAPELAPATTPAEDAGTATAGTPAAEELTLGDLAARVNAAWKTIGSYRVTFTGPTVVQPTAAATPAATPIASPGATPVARQRGTFASVREVVLPDRQHQEVTGLGPDDHEAVAIGDQLFVRGPIVEQFAPGTPPDTWVAVDTAALPEDAALRHLLGGLPQTPAGPLAALPERLMAQTVRDLGTVEFDARECQVYGAADTVTATGMRLDYAIAIDERDLPCFIETSAGGVTRGRDEYTDIGEALTIESPAGATPVAVSGPLATPVAHD
jgi:hypothetical protein